MEIKLCNFCANYVGGLKCLAFPDGIPDEILDGSIGHDNPVFGQGNDFVFAQKEKPI